MFAALSTPQIRLTAPAARRRPAAIRASGGVKSARRLLGSLNGAADGAAAEAIVRKYVAGSSKSASLGALSYLLSVSSPFAVPVYSRISKTNWFKWNPKTAASIATFLELQNESFQAETLISDSISRLDKSPKDLSLFYCNLIESLSRYGLTQKANEVYMKLQSMPLSGRKPFELMIKSLCLMGNPIEAESKLKEMILLGYHPSRFEFVLIAQSYGKLDSFLEMERVIGLMEEFGVKIDTICANVILSCYGDLGDLEQMVSWLKKMTNLGVPFCLRTFNTCLISCQTLVEMINDDDSLPLSMKYLIEKLETDNSSSCIEAMVLKELVKDSSVLDETLNWSETEVKLDLHGSRAVSAYIILLQWIDEMKSQLSVNGAIIPNEISVVCGIGKHSVEGKSRLRVLISRVLSLMNSPMRLDRKNPGRFIGRGMSVKKWLFEEI
ncbi:hypothetical protein LUZ60_009423 [Juncus effusus]|nr:hypothetical protein LUZ60_009423 [Juncus effusus]